MFNYWVSRRLEFGTDDKRECLETAKKIVELAAKVRKNGVLALEEEIDSLENEFFKTAVRLVVDSVNPEDIKKILQNHIIAGNYRNRRLFKRMLITEGMLAILQGYSPGYICDALLASYFGESFLPEYREYFGISENPKITVDDFLNQLKIKQSFMLSGIEIYEGLDDYAMQILVRESSSIDIARLFSGSPENVIRKFTDNMSKRSAEVIMENCLYGGWWNSSEEDCIASNNRLRNKLKELEDSNIIAL